MAKLKLRGKDLVAIGYTEGPAIGTAISVMHQHYKRKNFDDAIIILKNILENPEAFLNDEKFAPVSRLLLKKIEKDKAPQVLALAETPLNYQSYGLEGIERGAIAQMETAMRLPVTVAGALMPDAHEGYGLPIGGVLATENAVIPYGVGMDIGCRMCLTMYDLKSEFLEKNRTKLKDLLLENTRFGQAAFEKPFDDEVLTRLEFQEIPILKKLKQKAVEQIGSSGSGNHFVEFGIVNIIDPNNEFHLPIGEYVGILSHSGSRGFGANIAQHFTKVAMDKTPLPKEAKHLAWLSLDDEAGIEYWLAMNLAGDYASANHRHIHLRLAQALGQEPIAKVENHHNFAWKEFLDDGREVIIHRKGATPAKTGVLGIIPGSMTAPGFIVRGKGKAISLNSASHGAGRKMSRRKAQESFSKSQLDKYLQVHGVDLIGGGLDEAPFAYKNIEHVMAFQSDLVEAIGTFLPKIVRMDRA
ncbi:MAG: RtcB family protein [Saprospiraceae bacterium]|nr:RtcB family protein [Saprospiraceae bacterium]